MSEEGITWKERHYPRFSLIPPKPEGTEDHLFRVEGNPAAYGQEEAPQPAPPPLAETPVEESPDEDAVQPQY